MTSLALTLRPGSTRPLGIAAKATFDFLSSLAPNPALNATRPGPATTIDPDGAVQWGPHNLYSEPYALVTQNVTVTAGSHIVSFSGTGSVTLSGAATGTISGTGAANRVYLLVTTTSGTLTSTVTGSVNSAQLECVTGTNRTTPSDYVDSTVRNRVPYSNDFTQWTAASGGTGVAPKVYPNVSVGPNGQPAALISFNIGGGLTGSDVSYITNPVTTFAGPGTGGLLVKTADGSTKNLTFRVGASTFAAGQQINGTWQQLSLQGAGTIDRIALLAYGNADSQTANILVCDAQLNPGTTLWPYSYNPGAAPAVGPKYGLRTEYDTSTVSGIGPDLLSGSGSFDVDAAAWTPVNSPTVVVSGGKVSITNNGATNGMLYKAVPTVAGKAYVIKGDVVYGGGFARIESSNAIPNSVGGSGINVNASGSYQSPPFVALGATTYIAVGNRNDSNATNTFDNIVVQEAFAGAIAGYGPELASLPYTARGTTSASAATFTLTTSSVTAGTYGVVAALPDLCLSGGKSYAVSYRLVSKSAVDANHALVIYPSAGQNSTLGTALNSFKAATQTSPHVPGSTGTLTIRSEGGTATVGDTFVIELSVKEIIFAPKGALIEGQATQLLANPDDLSATPWTGSEVSATSDGTVFRGRPMWKVAKTTSNISQNRQNTTYTAPAGTYTLPFRFLASSNCSQVDFGLTATSGWGADADCSATVLSGPGTLGKAVTGACFRLTGLSTNVPTVVSVTRTIQDSGGSFGPLIYPDLYTSVTSGKAIYCQVDNLEAGTVPTSFIPNPATSGTVTRLADTDNVGFDDLARAWPWLMDTNMLVNPDTPTTQPVTTTAQQYTVQMQGTGTCTLSGTATGVLTGTGANNVETLTVTATAGTLALTFAGSNTNGKINSGPVAQTYYPVASKQGCIVFEGDMTYGATSGGMSAVALENGASNRVELYKGSNANTLSGLFNANSGSPGSIASGVPFKVAIGFSQTSAGIVLNGGNEAAITPSTFTANPNILKIGNDAVGSVASSMRLRRLRLLNTNPSAAVKQALTRLP